MQRDLEYMIDLLRGFEESDSCYLPFPETLDMDHKELHHLQLPCDEKMIHQVSDHSYRITKWGHDFLDLTKKDRLQRIRDELKEEYGNTPLEMVVSMGRKLLEQKLGIQGMSRK